MRLLLILIVAAFAGCGVSPDDSVKKGDEQDDMHTAADEAQESFGTALDKAENVEDELAKAAEQRRKAIEEASGE